MRKPYPIDLVRSRGHLVFGEPFSANLIVVRGPGKPGDWDGVLYLAATVGTGTGWAIEAWPCATRPGPGFVRSPVNPLGCGMLAPAQNRLSHALGLHRGRPALVQVGAVAVLRDPDRDALLEPTVPEVNRGGGFNVHDVNHPGELAGCIGLVKRHLDELLESYRDLARRFGREQRVTLTVIEG